MFKHYINLRLKAFLVSGKSIGLKNSDGLLVVFYLFFLVVGIALYPIYQKPSDQKPLAIVNSYVIFWLAIELIFRFFLCKVYR
jgi:hypothetical protein